VEDNDLLISSHVVVTKEFIEQAESLQVNESLWQGAYLLAKKGDLKLSATENKVQVELTYLTSLWDLTEKSSEVLKSDISLVRKRKYGIDIVDKHTVAYNRKEIFIEEGAVTRAAILNAENGPVFISKGAQILEGTVIYGPAFIGENTIVGTNSRLLGGTFIGQKCVLGGEIKRSYIQGNTNKAHEGYLGDSILGEWCNLGAGTNVSNLKNNFGNIKMWSYADDKVVDSERWKAGVLMGDYCKTAIGSRINSGTTMGLATVIFSPELTDKFYTNFSWGDEVYDFEKFIITARKMWELNGFDEMERLEEVLLPLSV
jgi:UDP-N-acetylglucosamine diphosphorylase/glucosamine-1-phosphate N-acetyltransferase